MKKSVKYSGEHIVSNIWKVYEGKTGLLRDWMFRIEKSRYNTHEVVSLRQIMQFFWDNDNNFKLGFKLG